MLRLPRAAVAISQKINKHQAHQNHSHHFHQTTFLPLLLLIIFLSGVSCVVVYQVRFIATKNGRTDYALAGESIELSCHYIMKDEAEDVKQLVWSKDGKNFLRWRKHKPGLEVLSYTFKGHVDPLSKHSHITLHNVTIDMHGKYKCSVKTDLGTHEMEQDLVVISQSNCKLNDWRVVSEPNECRELFRLDCRNMFPKPVPSCGLWNGKLEKFIRSVMVDISEEPNRQTYRVRYADKFELKKADGSVNSMHADLLQYAGHLMFKCDIIVPETSWKLSLIHKMFDYDDGCLQDPLDTIERMRSNYSHYATTRMQQAGYLVDRQLDEFEMLSSSLEYELMGPKMKNSSLKAAAASNSKLELNCWQKPRHGSLARLSCATKGNQVKLTGANLLECQPSVGWMPISGPKGLINQNQIKSSSSSSKKVPRAKGPLPVARSSRRVTVVPQSGSSNGGGIGATELERVNLDDTNTNDDDDDSRNFSITQSENSNDLEESRTISSLTTVPSTEVELIPTTTETTSQSQTSEYNPMIQQSQFSSLSPAQLASLLPSCISTRRYVHHHNHHQATTNRLPLMDEDSRVRASSSSSSSEKLPPKDRSGSSTSIFNFYSSSGCSRVPSGFISVPITFTLISTAILTMLSYSTQSTRLLLYPTTTTTINLPCYLSCR